MGMHLSARRQQEIPLQDQRTAIVRIAGTVLAFVAMVTSGQRIATTSTPFQALQ
jgi:hypothetical protein